MKLFVSLSKDLAFLEDEFKKLDYELMVRTGRSEYHEGGSKMDDANNWKADLYLAITNGKSGSKILACGSETGKSWNYCKTFAKNLRANTNINRASDWDIENGDDYEEISKTNMVSVYIITPKDVEWVLSNINDFMKAVTKSIEETMGIVVSIPEKELFINEPKIEQSEKEVFVKVEYTDKQIADAIKIIASLFR